MLHVLTRVLENRFFWTPAQHTYALKGALEATAYTGQIVIVLQLTFPALIGIPMISWACHAVEPYTGWRRDTFGFAIVCRTPLAV